MYFMLKDKLVPNIQNLMRETLESTLREIQHNQREFVVWGAGNTGQSTLEYIHSYSKGNIAPKYIVDNNKGLWGINNIKSPEVFWNEMNEIDVVLVCVYVADQVVAQIKEHGYKGEIIPISMSLFHMDEEAIRFYDENMDKLEKMYAILADERSKATVETFLNVLRTADISLWNKVNGKSDVKLMDPEMFDFSREHHMVDVGAFTGDTISKFYELCEGRYKSIAGFEPDEHNFSALKEFIEHSEYKNVILFQAAAGAENGVQHFINNRSESCVLSEDEGDEIQIVALDSVEQIQDMTLLKVSANGWDLGVLKGAQGLIQKNKPQISAYASGSLLWEIPFFLHEILPEYKIYYRHYGIGRQAMICYAIAE